MPGGGGRGGVAAAAVVAVAWRRSWRRSWRRGGGGRGRGGVGAGGGGRGRGGVVPGGGGRGGVVAVADAPETQVTPHDKKISCLVTAQKKGASGCIPDAPMGALG